MYQSKLSLRPSSLGEAGGEGKDCEEGSRRAEAAVMRWAFDEGTSHAGRIEGTSVYSCHHVKVSLTRLRMKITS